MDEITVSTDSKLSVHDITDAVRGAIDDTATGTVTVFSQHTTAAVTVNEAESNLLDDFAAALDGLVADSGWQHDRLDGNADAHVRSLLLGPDVTIPVEDGDLQLGTWQSVLLVECDGPRTRTVVVTSP
jgi:secondary thiamine-phosphate synthase enzyme